ncbi:hypothetical protein ABH942_002996 [Flavobacterium sp. 28YEA47A]
MRIVTFFKHHKLSNQSNSIRKTSGIYAINDKNLKSKICNLKS